MRKRKTKAEQLADRLAEIGHPVRADTFMRTRASRQELDSGAWQWSMDGESQPGRIQRGYGSTSSITHLLSFSKIGVVASFGYGNVSKLFDVYGTE